MTLDLDLVRRLLLDFEKGENLSSKAKDKLISGHVEIMQEANLIHAVIYRPHTSAPAETYQDVRIKYEGYNFIASVRSKTHWELLKLFFWENDEPLSLDTILQYAREERMKVP